MKDVIIIGAGMAGLSAALELKKRGLSYYLLEAAGEPGGRALTARMPSGTVADLGAHWLHGEKNPLHELLHRYNIPHRKDKGAHNIIVQHGQAREASPEDWLDKAIDHDTADYIKHGQELDRPVTDLAANEKGRETLRAFATMWNGLDPPLAPSAREFLTDESVPGGLQLPDGMQTLMEKAAADVGPDNIRFNTIVTAVRRRGGAVYVETAAGATRWGRAALFTGSLGVINSRLVEFDPPLSDRLRGELDGLVMGKMNKIILEVNPEFFEQNKIPIDLSAELLDDTPPHFCHVRSGGAPLITLFISGNQAEDVERMDEAEALAFARRILAPLKELAGFDSHLVAPPLITRWSGNPFTRGAYSSCLPGGHRPGPWIEGPIGFCGDTFDPHYPGSLAGAFLSGRKAAELIV